MTLQPGTLFTVNKIKTRDVSPTAQENRSHQPQPAPDASSLANYVCTRLHQYESAHRLICHAPLFITLPIWNSRLTRVQKISCTSGTR